jgi:hypothetical protein
MDISGENRCICKCGLTLIHLKDVKLPTGGVGDAGGQIPAAVKVTRAIG